MFVFKMHKIGKVVCILCCLIIFLCASPKKLNNVLSTSIKEDLPCF